MNYVPPCTEEEFNMVQKAMLDDESVKWAQSFRDWDCGARQLTPLGQELYQAVFDNAVEMGLMTKKDLGHGFAPLYTANPHPAYQG